MATEYNQVLVGDIDITDTYQKLMKASVGQDSVYLKAKETLTDFYANSQGLTDIQRSTMLSDAIVSIAKQITSDAMQMALKIDTENRDAAYALTKLKEDTRMVTANIAKIEKDTEDADWAVKNRVMAGWKAQAELYRDYGVQAWNQTVTTDIIPQAAYTEYGIKTETLKKAKADLYQSYASGYRNNGQVSVVLDANGNLSSATADNNGLIAKQIDVSIRQEKAFDDNKRQHVANSSASMIGLLLSTQEAGINYTQYLDKWVASVDYLNTNTL